jgi:hypothetical protein
MTHHPSTASAEAMLQKQADDHKTAADSLRQNASELDAQADRAREDAEHHIAHHEACKEALRVISAHKREHPTKDKGEQPAAPVEPEPAPEPAPELEQPPATEPDDQAEAQTD